MRHIIFLGLLIIFGAAILFSCEKYKDSKAVTDPRLTNPYCNDPAAVNYNWGFPGKPDSTVCIYPTQLFTGVYLFHDSVSLTASGLFIYADSFTLTITALSKTKIAVAGICGGGNSLTLTAGTQYVATVDTAEGDTTTNYYGQQFCSMGDTVNGTFTKDNINDSLMYISLQVASDTGVITTHTGSAYRIR